MTILFTIKLRTNFLRSGAYDQGLWQKSVAIAEGDASKAAALYTTERAQILAGIKFNEEKTVPLGPNPRRARSGEVGFDRYRHLFMLYIS